MVAPTASARDPTQSRPSLFAAIDMAPYLDADHGRTDLMATIILPPSTALNSAAHIVVGLTNPQEAVTLRLVAVEDAAGHALAPEADQHSALASGIVLAGDTVRGIAPEADGTLRIVLRGTVTATGNGRVEAGAMVASFDGAWHKQQAGGRPAEAYSASIIAVRGMPGAPVQGRGAMTAVLPLAGALVVVPLAGVVILWAPARQAPARRHGPSVPVRCRRTPRAARRAPAQARPAMRPQSPIPGTRPRPRTQDARYAPRPRRTSG
jgi:hypothetical protein